MEFLSLSRRRSSARNVPSGEERGETDVFAGYSSLIHFSRIHFSPTDGFSNERVAQFNLEWIFIKLDSGFQSLVGFRILNAGFRIPSPGFRISRAFLYMGRKSHRFFVLNKCVLWFQSRSCFMANFCYLTVERVLEPGA